MDDKDLYAELARQNRARRTNARHDPRRPENSGPSFTSQPRSDAWWLARGYRKVATVGGQGYQWQRCQPLRISEQLAAEIGQDVVPGQRSQCRYCGVEECSH